MTRLGHLCMRGMVFLCVGVNRIDTHQIYAMCYQIKLPLEESQRSIGRMCIYTADPSPVSVFFHCTDVF